MKIVDVRVQPFVHKTTSTHDVLGHRRPGAEHDIMSTLVTVVSDEGAEGYSFGATPVIVEQVIKPLLVGEDPFDREMLWQRMSYAQRNHPDLYDAEISAIDLALWDLAGRYLDQPVYKLLGGYRDKVLAYASTTLGNVDPEGLGTPEAYAELAEACIKRGFKAIKLHTWMPPVPSWEPDPKMDVKACAAVREAVGPDVPLMLDCWHFFSREQALYIGREIEKLDFHWLEEPMNEYSISSYAWLAGQLDIPVLGPEVAWGHHHTRAEWIVQGACDMLRGGVGRCGGITPLMKIVHLAESFGMSLELHGPGAGNLHVLGAMSIPGEFIELRADPSPGATPPPWLNAAVDAMDDEGYVHMPQGPGLGEDINFDYIRANAIEAPPAFRLQRQK